MTPVAENYNGSASSWTGEGGTNVIKHGDGVQVEIIGTEEGGAVVVRDGGKVVLDTNLKNGQTTEVATSDGSHIELVGDTKENLPNPSSIG